MRKTIKALLIAGSLGAMCAGLAACSDKTLIDEYFDNGNVITVTYDGSGGNILGSSKVTIVDMFNPEKFTADSDGYVHIKLRSPTDPERPHTGSDDIKVLRSGYSLVGWYKTREVVKVGDDVFDDKGNKLVERDGDYFKISLDNEGNEVAEPAIPQYTFADPWDFTTDTVDFKIGDEKLEMTLYAAWVPRFSFDYYYKVEGKEGDWKQFATTTFDYPAAVENEKAGKDSKELTDRVFIPDWSSKSGKMEHYYSDAYTFPSVTTGEKLTFKAAYSDKACTDVITREKPLKHGGSIDYATAKEQNDRQSVYVIFEPGSYYRVSTAQQFSDIADPEGYYTILSDELDFNCVVDYNNGGELSFAAGDGIRWPFAYATFKGKIEGENGKAVTFKNVGVQYSSSSAKRGGLFGEIDKNAVIKNVSFENVTFDVKKASGREEAYFGMFAGFVNEAATVQNVKVGGEIRLWSVEISKELLHFNLITNTEKGATLDVASTNIKVIVCGEKRLGVSENEEKQYIFSISPDSVLVKDGFIECSTAGANVRYQEEQYIIKYGGELS